MLQRFMITVKENRSWLILSFLLFAGGAGLSYISLTHEPELFAILEETSLPLLQELSELVFGGHPLRGAAILFLHNLTSVLQVIFFGIILGILPLFSAIANGAILGALTFQLSQEGIAPLPFLMAGILPHGIFELPAFLLSAALGLKFGYHVVFPIPQYTRRQSLALIFQEIGIVLPVVFILLLLAALLEVFVTPGVLEYYLAL
ncbi:MAG: stage II sporulation protein M [Bacillota bacterium]|nr:stage II sporulation protein M [Bacillota bacterium]MDW7682590.1 stage II sporulation protein M [Bacillota bacterium]